MRRVAFEGIEQSLFRMHSHFAIDACNLRFDGVFRNDALFGDTTDGESLCKIEQRFAFGFGEIMEPPKRKALIANRVVDVSDVARRGWCGIVFVGRARISESAVSEQKDECEQQRHGYGGGRFDVGCCYARNASDGQSRRHAAVEEGECRDEQASVNLCPSGGVNS